MLKLQNNKKSTWIKTFKIKHVNYMLKTEIHAITLALNLLELDKLYLCYNSCKRLFHLAWLLFWKQCSPTFLLSLIA